MYTLVFLWMGEREGGREGDELAVADMERRGEGGFLGSGKGKGVVSLGTNGRTNESI